MFRGYGTGTALDRPIHGNATELFLLSSCVFSHSRTLSSAKMTSPSSRRSQSASPKVGVRGSASDDGPCGGGAVEEASNVLGMSPKRSAVQLTPGGIRDGTEEVKLEAPAVAVMRTRMKRPAAADAEESIDDDAGETPLMKKPVCGGGTQQKPGAGKSGNGKSGTGEGESTVDDANGAKGATKGKKAGRGKGAGKGRGKGAGKGVGTQIMRRPAAAAVMRRPAAAMQGGARPAAVPLSCGETEMDAEEAQSEVSETALVVAADGTPGTPNTSWSQIRDKMKARQFNTMWQQRTLPVEVLDKIAELTAAKNRGTESTTSVGLVYYMGVWGGGGRGQGEQYRFPLLFRPLVPLAFFCFSKLCFNIQFIAANPYVHCIASVPTYSRCVSGSV